MVAFKAKYALFDQVYAKISTFAVKKCSGSYLRRTVLQKPHVMQKKYVWFRFQDLT